MNYLLDRKTQQRKFLKIALGAALLMVLVYFRGGIGRGLSSVGHFIFRPILILGNGIGGKLEDLGSYFLFKDSLFLENKELKSKIAESEADRANYQSVVAENAELKEILERKNEKANLMLSAILSKPNRSPYDTLVIDVGTEQGIQAGDMVFVLGNIPIGRVAEVYADSAKVVLFSSPGEKTQAVIKDGVFMEIIGRGGGNFKMILPRDFVLQKGDTAVLPGIYPYVLAVVESIISDPRDPFAEALLVSPVNIQEFKFVEVEK